MRCSTRGTRIGVVEAELAVRNQEKVLHELIRTEEPTEEATALLEACGEKWREQLLSKIEFTELHGIWMAAASRKLDAGITFDPLQPLTRLGGDTMVNSMVKTIACHAAPTSVIRCGRPTAYQKSKYVSNSSTLVR